MPGFVKQAKKLQSAINRQAGAKILLYTQQWYSKDKDRPITCYVVKCAEDHKTQELFRTYSAVQLVLWLRDYWYTFNGWEVPTDNEVWEEMKRNGFKGKTIYDDPE